MHFRQADEGAGDGDLGAGEGDLRAGDGDSPPLVKYGTTNE